MIQHLMNGKIFSCNNAMDLGHTLLPVIPQNFAMTFMHSNTHENCCLFQIF